MTNEEAKKMLKAKLDCLTYETAGCNYDCNNRLCDGCNLNYAQGNMGEQKQALEMAIRALEQTERIAKLVNELDLADILPKDYDNIFYLQSVKEVKEEMWRMYRFAKDVSYTLMAESEDKE